MITDNFLMHAFINIFQETVDSLIKHFLKRRQKEDFSYIAGQKT